MRIVPYALVIATWLVLRVLLGPWLISEANESTAATVAFFALAGLLFVLMMWVAYRLDKADKRRRGRVKKRVAKRPHHLS